ncbi:hypothetical protein FOYG_16795 [Fusarium oxysporum NRRL 32931]|uniref:Uncharacterized protein n=1 Tax=Fusarium oxysporum NRRL 32931 TaxID=660029 RepID=W9HEA5_FUSOX|nr:hypothetical protein FOYG_16795 [Fusarium oxysporum NRRL 32931]
MVKEVDESRLLGYAVVYVDTDDDTATDDTATDDTDKIIGDLQAKLDLNHRVAVELLRNKLPEGLASPLLSWLCKSLPDEFIVKMLICQFAAGCGNGYGLGELHCTRYKCDRYYPFVQLQDWWEHMYGHWKDVFADD